MERAAAAMGYREDRKDQEQQKPESLAKRAVYWIASWLLCLAIWELFVDKLAWNEFWIGAAAAVFAATATEAVRGLNFARFWPSFRWVAEGWRLPIYAVTGTYEIFLTLGKQVFLGKPAQSLVLAARYDAGGDDARSAARRALTIAFTTALPNFVIIGIDRERSLMVFHQVSRSGIPQMTKNLGAQ